MTECSLFSQSSN